MKLEGGFARSISSYMDMRPTCRATEGEQPEGARPSAITSESRGQGIPFWSLADVYEGYDREDLSVSALDGHPNETGHRIAASRVADLAAPSLKKPR